MARTLSVSMNPPMTARKTTKQSDITSSIWPRPRNNANSQTPKVEPNTPPNSSMSPILKSTLRRRQWASAPETEAATT